MTATLDYRPQMATGDAGPNVVGQLLTSPWVPQTPTVRINQGYGPTSDTAEPPGHNYLHFHPGVDLDYPSGTVVYFPHLPEAAVLLHLGVSSGTFHQGVWNAQKRKYLPDPGGYGDHATTITIGNPAKLDVILGHGMAWLQPDGATVRAGDPLIKTDNEGNSTGPHLHFEIRPVRGGYGTDVDPWPLVVGESAINAPGTGGSGVGGGMGGPAAVAGSSATERWHGDIAPQVVQPGIGGPTPTDPGAGESPQDVGQTGGVPLPSATPPGQGNSNPARQNVCGFFAGNCTALMASIFPCCCPAQAKFNLGNGGQWYANAKANGWPTSTTPQVGWVASFDGPGWSSAGHVGLIVGFSGASQSSPSKAQQDLGAAQQATGKDTITLYSMNFSGLGQVTTNQVSMSGFQGCFNPPCAMVNGPSGVNAPGSAPTTTASGCPSWAFDPEGFFACEAQQAMAPVGTAIRDLATDVEKIALGSALTMIGAGIMGGSLWIGVGQIRQTGMARQVTRSVPTVARRRPAGRATTGMPAAPPQAGQQALGAPRPTRRPLVSAQPTERTVRLIQPRTSASATPALRAAPGPRAA